MSSILSTMIAATIILYPQGSVYTGLAGDFPTSSQLEADKATINDALSQRLPEYQEGDKDCVFGIIIKNNAVKVTSISHESRRPECSRVFKAIQNQTVKLITKEGLKGILFVKEEKL
ncbi:hypothetical protein K6U40_09960 [Vibrio fluvialis]|uniref:hypothetical protein n=1 Tax=Vibrio fluvialis TaxID=676 RepID=UPI001EEBFCFD|nr:hypothetical protein [Vibrio fluvialis]MCG6345820.1 hypothetical protein [Vibrio fluvialis]MCG6386263.1 hypothetical protein [Vibrio fluvialis]